jgi:hypothetical protein
MEYIATQRSFTLILCVKTQPHMNNASHISYNTTFNDQRYDNAAAAAAGMNTACTGVTHWLITCHGFVTLHEIGRYR